MRTSIFASLALVASFALAGCAVDSNEPSTEEQTDDTTQAGSVGDGHLKNAIESDNNYVVHTKPQLGNDETSRMYDFSSVPRASQRAPFELSLQEVLSNIAIERSQAPQRAFGVAQESHLGVTTH
jgi:hypothetical protein